MGGERIVYESPWELKRQGRLPKGWHDPDQVKILHKFRDGTVRESLEGVAIPDTEETREFFRLLRLVMENGVKAAETP